MQIAEGIQMFAQILDVIRKLTHTTATSKTVHNQVPVPWSAGQGLMMQPTEFFYHTAHPQRHFTY
jgi:hypothetical protein